MSIRDDLNEIAREMAAIATAVDVTTHAAAVHESEAATTDQGDFFFCPQCRYIELSKRQETLTRVMHDPRVDIPTSPSGVAKKLVEDKLVRDEARYGNLKAANLLPVATKDIEPAKHNKVALSPGDGK